MYEIFDEGPARRGKRKPVTPYVFFFIPIFFGPFGLLGFLWNTTLFKSDHSQKEYIWIVAGIVGGFALILTNAALVSSGVLPKWSAPYLSTIATTYLLICAYFIFKLQMVHYNVYLFLRRRFQTHD